MSATTVSTSQQSLPIASALAAGIASVRALISQPCKWCTAMLDAPATLGHAASLLLGSACAAVSVLTLAALRDGLAWSILCAVLSVQALMPVVHLMKQKGGEA